MNTHHESPTITNAACVTLRVSSTCIMLQITEDVFLKFDQSKRSISLVQQRATLIGDLANLVKVGFYDARPFP